LSLVHEPAVLFLDEPTTGLDPMSRINLWDEVRSLNAERGTTVFLTTQYLEEADQLAGRIAIIDHGRIVREGTPAELKGEVGAPTLVLRVHADHRDLARKALGTLLGPERPSGSADDMAFGLVGGAARMAEVVRALDEVGAVIEHLELAEPSLDDVFAEATGRRLEGADDDGHGDGSLEVPAAGGGTNGASSEADGAPVGGVSRRKRP
jgi:ABC-2 type transport system ATP-binding protein